MAKGATIKAVKVGSPADDAGFSQGCVILEIDGLPLRDMIDWRWHASDFAIALKYRDLDGDEGIVELERSFDEDWGIEFEGVVFDGIKLCRNACSFCFMRQLPDGMRPSLSLRDDDFRLSFLQGTFATLTNITQEDEERIVEQHITPLHVSLHAISPKIRQCLIGKHAHHGLEACERLLEAGIEMRMQIVLVPGVNDGIELEKTLSWAYTKPGVLSVGVVPLGFTRHQSGFESSYNERDNALAVLKALESFQPQAMLERGNPWVFAADEFYRNAFHGQLLKHLPAAEFYGDYAMFEDGIGIIRYMVDEWEKSQDAIEKAAAVFDVSTMTCHSVMGFSQYEHFSELVQRSPLNGRLIPLPIKNKFFGGNVDVTGLLCGCDIVEAIQEKEQGGELMHQILLPDVILNDDGITLDGMSVEDMQNELNTPLAVVSCNPSEYVEEIAKLVKQKPNA